MSGLGEYLKTDTMRRLNPDFVVGHVQVTPAAKAQSEVINKTLAAGKRIRQNARPLLNQLETEFLNVYLRQYYQPEQIHAQRFKICLANGLWYKPDFVTITGEGSSLWEVKGPYAFRGGLENLKKAADVVRGIKCFLVWKEHGEWKQQEVLPL